LNSLTLTDPVYRETEHTGALSRFVLKQIVDRRDLPFVRLIVVLTALVVVPAVYLATPGHFRWWLGVLYLLMYGAMLGPYTLMLHNTSHRKLFQRRIDGLNQIIPWFLGPFFGQSPGTYFSHHIEMHHKEANLPTDLSSTMKYQRDSVLGFAHYFLTFFFFGLIQLSIYFYKQRRFKLMAKTLVGEVFYFAAAGALIWYDWRVGFVILVAPFVITRFAMMAGNWGQHAFVDRTAPENSYKNSITCINTSYNQRCFNDGYHIGHHVRRTRHWTEMPGDFLANQKTYVAEASVVFHGVDFFAVWFFLMLKRYNWLAARFVDLREDDALLRHEEIEALLRERTRRIPPGPRVSVKTLPTAAPTKA
jgi:fatty acid desaturase